MELPLGVFTIAVATVFFPLLAKALSNHDETAFSAAFLKGLRLVVGISLPAGIGLFVLGEPIIELLFFWGAFEQADVLATVPLLAIYGLGLPFYSAATFATRGLHASKDMRTPVKVAAYCLLINLFFGLILMQFWAAAGLAAANVVAYSLRAGCSGERFRQGVPLLVTASCVRLCLKCFSRVSAWAILCLLMVVYGWFRIER